MTKRRNQNYEIFMKYSVSQLEKIIVALLNNSNNKKFAGNVRLLFGMFSKDSYQNDFEKDLRVYLITTISDLIIEKKISDKDSILNLINLEGKYENEAVELLNGIFNNSISDQELGVLDTSISDQLRYSFLDRESDKIMELLTNLKAENFGSLSDIVRDLTDNVNKLQKDLRESSESIENVKNNLSFDKSSLEKVIGEIIEEEKNPAAKVKTGIRAFNEMMNGGFEKGRLYIACAVAKGGKSAFLLNTALWARKYNTFRTKNPENKPVILYLTMENSIKETMQRLYAISFGDSYNFADKTKKEAVAMLQSIGILGDENENDGKEEKKASLEIVFRRNKSINTNDLIGMLDEYEKNGKEVVMVIFDYLKRIRSISPNKEIRLELSQITDELCSIAKDRDIPILSASQLNRDAFRVLEDARSFEEKAAAIEKIGNSSIGESIDIIQNADCAFVLNNITDVKYGDDDQLEYCDKYLSVKLLASRTKQPRFTEFKHKYKDGFGLALDEDIFKPMMTSILSNSEMIRTKANVVKTSGKRKLMV